MECLLGNGHQHCNGGAGSADWYTARMALRRKIRTVIVAVFVGLVLIILLNSGLGVDADETFTDAHRPEIVGQDRSLSP